MSHSLILISQLKECCDKKRLKPHCTPASHSHCPPGQSSAMRSDRFRFRLKKKYGSELTLILMKTSGESVMLSIDNEKIVFYIVKIPQAPLAIWRWRVEGRTLKHLKASSWFFLLHSRTEEASSFWIRMLFGWKPAMLCWLLGLPRLVIRSTAPHPSSLPQISTMLKQNWVFIQFVAQIFIFMVMNSQCPMALENTIFNKWGRIDQTLPHLFSLNNVYQTIGWQIKYN